MNGITWCKEVLSPTKVQQMTQKKTALFPHAGWKMTKDDIPTSEPPSGDNH